MSHHAGSILANDGPEVPLTDEMLEKAKEVFKELAITFDDPGEEEGEGDGEGDGERRGWEGEGEGEGEGKSKIDIRSKKVVHPPILEASRLAQALFRCGATPVNVDSMTELTGVLGLSR